MPTIHTPAYRRFLKRLKQARLNAELTQVRVATLLSKKQAFVWKCEQGERRVDIIELQKFAKIYKKSLQFFVS